MSLCFCSILKPPFPNLVSRCRLAPNPNIRPFQSFNLQIHDKDFCNLKAAHADGIGVLYSDDTVSERTAPLGAEPGDHVSGAVNGVVGTATEETHEAPSRIRLKKMEGRKGNVEDGDDENRFKLRNGREVCPFCSIRTLKCARFVN